MNAKTLFSKFNLRKWIPYWKEDGGESIINEMERQKLQPYDFQDFYISHGDVQLEFMEKLITERIKRGDLERMSKVECAYLGLSEFQEFMKQIIAELNKRGVDAAVAAELTKREEAEKAKNK